MKTTIKRCYTGKVLFEGKVGMTTLQMLEKATTSNADLRGANLRGANLVCADLGGADLYGANLRSANLRGADLRGADLYGADLGNANLRSADLGNANLVFADLYGADLRGADLGEKFGKLVEGRAFFQCGPIGPRSDYLQSFITEKGIVIKTGCFTGFVDEFTAEVERSHGNSAHGKEYVMAIQMIEARAAIWAEKTLRLKIAAQGCVQMQIPSY